jgi:beta-lactam-binding protein with PASTA domain
MRKLIGAFLLGVAIGAAGVVVVAWFMTDDIDITDVVAAMLRDAVDVLGEES